MEYNGFTKNNFEINTVDLNDIENRKCLYFFKDKINFSFKDLIDNDFFNINIEILKCKKLYIKIKCTEAYQLNKLISELSIYITDKIYDIDNEIDKELFVYMIYENFDIFIDITKDVDMKTGDSSLIICEYNNSDN